MKKQLFVVYDNVAKAVASTILLADNKEVVLRDLKASKLPGTMETDSEDYDILHIGTLETDDGSIVAVVPDKIANLGGLRYGQGKDTRQTEN